MNNLNTKTKKFIDWCNTNSGFLAFIGILIAISIAILNNEKVHWVDTSSFLKKILVNLDYPIVLPIYLILLVVIIITANIVISRVKFKAPSFSFNSFVGEWLNTYIANEVSGFESVKITQDGKYYADGEHWFNITDFKYDAKLNQISFTKTSTRDNRQVTNILCVYNQNFLCGKEDENSIQYSRTRIFKNLY